MKALLLKNIRKIKEGQPPLVFADIPMPQPGREEVLIKVRVCGVCHTELDEIEGRTPPPVLPMVPGHQVVGDIVQTGEKVRELSVGDRVGVAWFFSSCSRCEYCLNGNENLCDEFQATGRDSFGGYAEYMTAPEKSVYKIPDNFTDAQAAPLLCAGAVGYRSLRLADIKDGQHLGLTGFGASAHLVLKLVKFTHPNTSIFAFARSASERQFAIELGAKWAGDIGEQSPVKLQAIIDTTPVWKPVVEAMANLKKGGRLVINAIRKEDIDKSYLQQLTYPDHLWDEKEIKSVANVTSRDVSEFLDLAARAEIRPQVEEYPMEEANRAIIDIKFKKIRGAKVLRISS